MSLTLHQTASLGIALAAIFSAACRTTKTTLSDRELAHYHLERNEPEKALPLLEALHQSAPDDLDVARSLVEAHVRSGRVSALIDRLKARAADTPVWHYMLGLAYFARAADAELPAITELERAVQLSPNEPELHHRLGLALLESERYEQALPPLERAYALAPERTAYALPLAKAYHRTGASAKAVEALRAVVSGEPTEAEVKVARALMDQIADPFARLPAAARPKLEEGLSWLFDRDVPQQAIVAFEEILRDWPDLAVVHALLGLAWQRIDDAARALDEIKRAIELQPEDGKNHFYLGELYLSRQRPKQAREHFERAVALNPLLTEAYARLGDLALERGELDVARSHFRTLTHLEPHSAQARGRLATALMLSGDFPGAARELERVLEREPENVEFQLRLGLLHAERHHAARSAQERSAAKAAAQKWLRQVLEAQPDNALASRALEGLK